MIKYDNFQYFLISFHKIIMEYSCNRALSCYIISIRKGRSLAHEDKL